MAKWVGLKLLLSAFASRRTLACLMTRSCIAEGMSADLSRTFKSTASAASCTWLAGGTGGFVAGTNANMRSGAQCTTFSLSFGGLLLLSFSTPGLSMKWERVFGERKSWNVWNFELALTGDACGFCVFGVKKRQKRGTRGLVDACWKNYHVDP